ncbi:MAG: TolC family protein, partial [Candidatus Eremiobacteraeota bacterium]|nr:TolC family protein [Candidatus Eremiobacteraeota bacterium]
MIGEVLQKNPGVAAARLNWEAMQEKPAIAGSLPDPMATYGYFFQNVETRVGAQNQRFGLSQKIPFPGKLSAQKRRASKEALM